MKPCSKNRKLLAWLALDALDAGKAGALREHIAHCDGCRGYWEEISKVTERLASAAPDSKLEVSELFHRRVAKKMQAVESGSVLEKLTVWLRGTTPGWRVALPGVAVLGIALFVLIAPREHPAVSQTEPAAVQVVAESSSEGDLAPTLANYQMVASQSLEKLDELLTKQGNKSLPPVPVYTASTLDRVNGSY